MHMHERYSPENWSMAPAAVRILKQLQGTKTPLEGWCIDWETALEQFLQKSCHGIMDVGSVLGPRGSSAHKDLYSCFCCKADQYNLPQELHVVKHVARTFFAALISQHSGAIEPEWSTKSWWE